MPASKNTETAAFIATETSFGGHSWVVTSAPHCEECDDANDALDAFEALYGEMETCTA